MSENARSREALFAARLALKDLAGMTLREVEEVVTHYVVEAIKAERRVRARYPAVFTQLENGAQEINLSSQAEFDDLDDWILKAERLRDLEDAIREVVGDDIDPPLLHLVRQRWPRQRPSRCCRATTGASA